jgi:plasmid stabilization system protein ParE
MAFQIIWSAQARDDLQTIVFRPYRSIYKVLAEKQAVAIARIWHGARGEPEIPGQLNF